MSVEIQNNVPLAPFTSFGCGGPAEMLAECHSREEVLDVLKSPLWRGGCEADGVVAFRILGYGANVLISDKGLPGLTIIWRGGNISIQNTTIRVDGGVWWDDVVTQTIEKGLWGMELMSGIPSSVAAALVGNIAAYGQQSSDRLVEIEVYDLHTQELRTVPKNELTFSYRHSSLQSLPYVIVSATFELSHIPTTELKYASAAKIASELGCDISTLAGRRAAILEARRRAGSLYDPKAKNESRTAGSFFKNPLTSPEVAEHIASFDESGKALELIKQQNAIHGGSTCRVSAAHVLIAAGFSRGQAWGPVRLHPDHILKIENTGNATAQEIYDVANILIKTVKEKLNITLEPEVKFMGTF